MRGKNLLSSKQYCFIHGRSTATQLLSYLDKYIDTIVSGIVVDAIHFDFNKAFDNVPHERLLGKLESHGINSNVLEWIKAFLRSGCQIVNFKGMKSDPATALNGFTQGSVLRPIFFVI